MKSLLQFVLLAVLFTGCKQRKLDPRDVAYFAWGEQAIVGSYILDAPNAGQGLVCTLDVSTNHTFAISNLLMAGSSKPISVTGSWAMTVYRVFDARGFAVSFAGVTNIIKARFPNGETPEGTTPTQLSVWWVERQGPPTDLRFKQVQKSDPLPTVE